MRILLIFAVGILWGCTNPFIKRAQAALSDHNKENTRNNALSFIRQLIQNPVLAAPFVINQIGSLFFYLLLATEKVSVASPMCNALALAFTAATGYFLGEKYKSPAQMAVGIILVYVGVMICSAEDDSE